MIVLISGPNGSGKSAYAESLACKLSKTRYYIATMKPYGAEGAARVEKHIRQRAGMGFLTLELPHSVGKAPLPADALVLLEDVSNLLGNVMFERCGGAEEVFADIAQLSQRAVHMLIVTIGSFDEGNYSEETKAYIQSMGQLNGKLAALADVVIELRGGVPFCRKGDADALA